MNIGPDSTPGVEIERLHTNREIQDFLVQRLLREKPGRDLEPVLRRAQVIGRLAASLPGGNLANPKLENFLLECGKKISDRANGRARAGCGVMPAGHGRRSILHVATTVFGTGGHSRVIGAWIERDSNSHHFIALTNQSQPVPAWLEAAAAKSGGEVVDLRKSGGLADRAAALSSVAGKGFDVVVVHHHPYDIVPSLAFAGEAPPIAVFNHADHVFWVGAAVCDLLVDFRILGDYYGPIGRHARTSIRVPLPLSDRFTTHPSRIDARRRLGIDSSAPVFLSIGMEYKYVPSHRQNFFSACHGLLERLPNAHVFIVGVPPNTRIVPAGSIHDRLHLVGVVSDPGDFLAGADVFLEPFPGGAATALLDCALSGLVPIMPPYAESELFGFEDPCFADFAKPPADESEWIEQAADLILDADRRNLLAQVLQARVRQQHCSQEWGSFAGEIYAAAEAAGHNPARLSSEPDPGFIIDHAWIGSSHFRVWELENMMSLLLTYGSCYGVRDWAAITAKALRLGEFRIAKGDVAPLGGKLVRFSARQATAFARRLPFMGRFND